MYNLTKEEKQKIIIKIVSENKLTAYEIGKKTKLSVSGIEKILDGITKKPQEKTLDIILDYLEKYQLFKKEKENSTQGLLEEPKPDEISKEPKSDLRQLLECEKNNQRMTIEIVRLQDILRKNNIEFDNIFENWNNLDK